MKKFILTTVLSISFALQAQSLLVEDTIESNNMPEEIIDLDQNLDPNKEIKPYKAPDWLKNGFGGTQTASYADLTPDKKFLVDEGEDIFTVMADENSEVRALEKQDYTDVLSQTLSGSVRKIQAGFYHAIGGIDAFIEKKMNGADYNYSSYNSEGDKYNREAEFSNTILDEDPYGFNFSDLGTYVQDAGYGLGLGLINMIITERSERSELKISTGGWILGLLINLLLCFWIFRSARKSDMNAWVWFILAFCTHPMIIGVIFIFFKIIKKASNSDS